MLIIPNFIANKELKKNKYFSIEDVKKLAKKVEKGIGITLKKEKKWDIIKIKSTINSVAGRSIFFLIIDSKDIIPIFLRTKKDSLGENISLQNKEVKNLLQQYTQ